MVDVGEQGGGGMNLYGSVFSDQIDVVEGEVGGQRVAVGNDRGDGDEGTQPGRQT